MDSLEKLRGPLNLPPLTSLARTRRIRREQERREQGSFSESRGDGEEDAETRAGVGPDGEEDRSTGEMIREDGSIEQGRTGKRIDIVI